MPTDINELKRRIRQQLTELSPEERDNALKRLESVPNAADIVSEWRNPVMGGFTEESRTPAPYVKPTGYVTRYSSPGQGPITSAVNPPSWLRNAPQAEQPAPEAAPLKYGPFKPSWLSRVAIEGAKTIGRTFQGTKPFGLFEIGKPAETPPPAGLPEAVGRIGAGLLGAGEPQTITELQQQPGWMQALMAMGIGGGLEATTLATEQAMKLFPSMIRRAAPEAKAILADQTGAAMIPGKKPSSQAILKTTKDPSVLEVQEVGIKVGEVIKTPGYFGLNAWRFVPTNETLAKKLGGFSGAKTPEEALAIYQEKIASLHKPPVEVPPAVPKPQVPETAAAKQPWQMTFDEYRTRPNVEISPQGGESPLLAEEHYNSVKQALSEGKPVPESVLADYPDLAKGAIKPSKAASGESIAKELDVTYNGVQKGFADVPDTMLFTDKQTGTTFAANSLDETKTRLGEVRAQFKVALPKPPGEARRKPVWEGKTPVPTPEPGVTGGEGVPPKLPSGRVPGGPTGPLPPRPDPYTQLVDSLTPKKPTIKDSITAGKDKIMRTMYWRAYPLRDLAKKSGIPVDDLYQVVSGMAAAGEDNYRRLVKPIIDNLNRKLLPRLQEYMTLMTERDLLARNPEAKLPGNISGMYGTQKALETLRRKVGNDAFAQIEAAAAQYWKVNDDLVLTALKNEVFFD